VVTGYKLNQTNANTINNVRREVSRHFKKKTKEYRKAKIDELETNSKIKVSDSCIGKSVTLIRVTRLELI